MFKDREDAAKQLLEKIEKTEGMIIVSLLRGGVILGNFLAKELSAPHLPLVVTKIPAPHQEELAIGALCFDIAYLEKSIVGSLNLTKTESRRQIDLARQKFDSYCRRFEIKEGIYNQVRGKTAVIVDDGIATGATSRSALLYLKSKGAQKVVLAVPVGPVDFDKRGFDEVIILKQELGFSSVSQFYLNFPQVEDEEVKKLIR